MPQLHRLPLHAGLLARPRVHALIEQGLASPLLCVLAGPGYGKTQALAGCLAERDARILWLRLTRLDNLPSHFWEKLTHALERELPSLAQRMKRLEFPDTLLRFELFLNSLVSELSAQSPVIWVIDDYGELSDPHVTAFFHQLADIGAEGFCLVLVSNVVSSMDFLSRVKGGFALISGEDLRFSQGEIDALYKLHGVTLAPSELRHIECYTQGWPLPLHLLLLQSTRAGLPGASESLTSHEVSRMFEQRFFSDYTPQTKTLLIQLSLLHTFTRELLFQLHEHITPAELDLLWNHVFIIREPTGQFSFHHMYRLFLQEKKHLLKPGDEAHAFQKAGAYYAATHHAVEAITCYRQCGDYISMLNAIADIARTQYGMAPKQAEFILEHLDLLSPDQLLDHPMADYLRAYVYLNILELEKSEALLLALEQSLLGNPARAELLGDVYASLGAVHMMRSQEDFGEYYKKACAYLPNGTNFKSKDKLFNHNNHNFSMADNRPGAKARMEQAVHFGVPWMTKALSGGMSGMEHLFSAEAAYLSYQLNDAQQYAYRAVYKARESAQHDLVCNAYCILARISLMQGNLGDTLEHIQSIEDYVERFDIAALREIRDTALAWRCVKLQDYDNIPRWILSADSADAPVLTYGRVQIVYANYLINTGQYAKMTGFLEHPKGLFLSQGIWPDRICLFIMLAIGYCHLGDMGAAMDALWAAFDLSFHNDLITPFVEAGKHMRLLVEAARQQTTHPFDPQWLDLVYKRATSFAKRSTSMVNEYKSQNLFESPSKNRLTKREQVILQDLSRGLTREEIAIEHYISVNTVKSFIRSIYNKLDAANRADAVSIAISNGYIDHSAKPE